MKRWTTEQRIQAIEAEIPRYETDDPMRRSLERWLMREKNKLTGRLVNHLLEGEDK